MKDHSQSPLWMITRDPSIHEFIVHLAGLRRKIEDDPNKAVELRISHRQLQTVRENFSSLIVTGERILHSLAELLCHSLTGAECRLNSVVVGRLPGNDERFTLSQPLTQQELYHTTDIDLGTRILNRIAVVERLQWSKPELVANYVEYMPIKENQYRVHKLISRFKAEEEIWNKVVDEIFEIDKLVRQDKILQAYSHYIKDVFGLKVVVADEVACRKIHQVLFNMDFDRTQLTQHGIRVRSESQRLELIETKDYLGAQAKGSGWNAIKSIARWGDTVLEVQIQPLHTYLMERDHLTRESHEAYRERRRELRERIAAEYPLFAFFQKLLYWLFTEPSGQPPCYDKVRVMVVQD